MVVLAKISVYKTYRMNAELYSLLERNGARYELIEHPPVVSMDDVEGILRVPREMMVKALIFQGEEPSYVVAAIRGVDRVSRRKLARVTGHEEGLTLLERSRVEEVTGLPFGGLRPFGYDERFKMVFDQAVMDSQTVFCCAGTQTETLIIAAADLREIARGIVADIRSKG